MFEFNNNKKFPISKTGIPFLSNNSLFLKITLIKGQSSNSHYAQKCRILWQWSNSSIQPHLLESFPSKQFHFRIGSLYLSRQLCDKRFRHAHSELNSTIPRLCFRGLITDAFRVCSPAKRLNVVSTAGNEYQQRVLKLLCLRNIWPHTALFFRCTPRIPHTYTHIVTYKHMDNHCTYICVYILL